jgi:hypothetical protein
LGKALKLGSKIAEVEILFPHGVVDTALCRRLGTIQSVTLLCIDGLSSHFARWFGTKFPE